jgi:nucleotide-binding universal stress UspA family protein
MIHPSADDREVCPKRLSAHLANHGVKIAADILQVRTANEQESLGHLIDQEHHDLLVMGAYSHPMWVEFIFGGTTQSILLSSKIPVLVSH